MNLIATFSNPEPYPNTSDSFIISLYLSLSFSLSHVYIHVEFKLNWKTEFSIKLFSCVYTSFETKNHIYTVKTRFILTLWTTAFRVDADWRQTWALHAGAVVMTVALVGGSLGGGHWNRQQGRIRSITVNTFPISIYIFRRSEYFFKIWS